MNITLETKLIILLLGIGYLFTLILIIAYEYKHLKNLKTNAFFLAKFTQTIAWFFMILRGGNFDFLSIALANSLLFITYSLEIVALLSIKQTLHKKAKIRYLVFTILSILGFLLIFTFYNKENVRIAYYCFVNTAIYISVYRIVFGKGLSLLLRVIGSMYLLFALGSLIRGIITITLSTFSTSLFTPSTYQLILLLSIFIFTNLGSIGFILLMKEKVDQELVRFASYDDLTGTLNRRTFTERAKQYLINYSKKRQPISFILFDIDNFKVINDTLGHHIGDQVLQHLAREITYHLDKDDLFGRYGGGEFGILMPGKNEFESTNIAEQIKQSLNNDINSNLPVIYTISMGLITITPEHSTQLELLYTSCDKALYKAKSNGRNSIFHGKLEEYHEVT